MEHSEIIVFTDRLVDDFAKVTGDINPIHINEDFAKDTIFKQKIVHGMFLGSIISKIIGTNLPGIGTIYLKQDMKFLAPVFFNKEYKVLVKVVEVNIEKSRVFLETEVYDNESKLKCIEGKALVMNKKWVQDNGK